MWNMITNIPIVLLKVAHLQDLCILLMHFQNFICITAEQVEEAAMGSQVSPIVVNTYME